MTALLEVEDVLVTSKTKLTWYVLVVVKVNPVRTAKIQTVPDILTGSRRF